MYVILMKKDVPVCKMNVHCLSLMGAIIVSYEVLDPSCMPVVLPEDEEIAKLMLRNWFAERVISNFDPELDHTMCEVYELNPSNYGRMHGYQYIGAFLSYLTSTKDEYWCNPVWTQYLSYAMVDGNCNRLYMVEPTTYEAAKIAGGKFRKCLRNP